MKRILCTGGAGAIGAQVIQYFLQETDWHITLLDSFRHKGFKDRITKVCENNPGWYDRLTIIQHDLVCAISPALKEKIGQVDYILHLAALSDVFFSVENPAYVIQNNILSTLTMLEYAKTVEHEAFIYFSTDEVYGPVEKGMGHKEWDTHRPSNAYAASKAASEDICYPYWRSGQVKLIITNTMNNFSPMQAPSKFPAMVQQKLNTGETVTIHGNEKEIGTRFYIHSKRVAATLHKILTERPPHPHQQGMIDDPDRYHIVGEKAVDNLTLARTIAQLMGKELHYTLVDFHKDNPAHDIHYGLENHKLTVEQDLEEDLKEVIEWQGRNPEWLR